MLFLSSLRLCLRAVTFPSQGDTQTVCADVCRDAWRTRKGERERAREYCPVNMSQYVLRCVGWLIQGDWVFLSPLFLPCTRLLFSYARARHPRTNVLFLYLAYLRPPFNGQRFFFVCVIFLCIPRGEVVCGGSMSAVLIEMIHVEVDSLRLCYLSLL